MTRVSPQGSYDLGMKQLHADHGAEVNLLRTEIERLRADNEWLRNVMRNAIEAQDFREARAALAGKP